VQTCWGEATEIAPAAAIGDEETLVGEDPSGQGGVGEAHEDDEPRSGTTLGRYVVLDKLGAGGMGVVYLAFDPELDRRVALKLLQMPPGAGSADAGTEGRARLLREAQAMAKVSHPNVVAVHDIGTLGDRVFVAMEFIEGVTLTGRRHVDRVAGGIDARLARGARQVRCCGRGPGGGPRGRSRPPRFQARQRHDR
jgi:hypothetical protein